MKHFRKKYIIFVIVAIILTIGVYKIISYQKAKKICEQIKLGEDVSTNITNRITAPKFMLKLTDILQIEGPKIPLVEACYYRNIQAVRILLENGADPNFYFAGHYSPLEASIAYGPIDQQCMEIVELLVEHGVDVNLYASESPVIVKLSGYICAGNENVVVKNMFCYLLEHGAEPQWNNSERILHDVIRGGDVKLVEYLIDNYSCDVNYMDLHGKSSLIVAVTFSQKSATVEMINMLLEKGGDKTINDYYEKTAYDYAVELGRKEIIELLK